MVFLIKDGSVKLLEMAEFICVCVVLNFIKEDN